MVLIHHENASEPQLLSQPPARVPSQACERAARAPPRNSGMLAVFLSVGGRLIAMLRRRALIAVLVGISGITAALTVGYAAGAKPAKGITRSARPRRPRSRPSTPSGTPSARRRGRSDAVEAAEQRPSGRPPTSDEGPARRRELALGPRGGTTTSTGAPHAAGPEPATGTGTATEGAPVPRPRRVPVRSSGPAPDVLHGLLPR